MLVMHMQTRCGSTSITDLLSLQVIEFAILRVLHVLNKVVLHISKSFLHIFNGSYIFAKLLDNTSFKH